ncbi:LysR family transcriptional regulator [Sphingomonas sp. CGMCC 1.13654]|uniref:LysR family transcriptional regulator n=1 Tax=Sphingomonas chungangi TaxID=2683589 RepID=A0A838L4L1_9SPHN|nr:LysR family transcriptional regulator [Sphingomonas chungangi]MBA2933146.1 LysR family transcriptional regulator [Sphingomonas chungangi]MVW57818.1 LysR family transcriptional regulator [Sphingomonas chungangi]
MLDLNSLQIFDKVASLKSFTAAARALGLPKSNVSRAIARLEDALGTRLFQRTTRDVVLTLTGQALLERSADIIASLSEALNYVGSLSGQPRGTLKISAGMGFGVNVLAEQLPDFLLRYPEIDISLDLESRAADLIADSVDVAVRLGPLPDSGLVAVKLGEMRRYLCAAPAYLERSGWPASIEDVARHDTIDMPAQDGRARAWSFSRGTETIRLETKPRISVNEALTIHRLVSNAAGLGLLSGYICGPLIEAQRLIHLFPDWSPPAVEVSLVFPSRRELSPTVRAFVDYMKEVNRPGYLWLNDSFNC